MAATTNNSTSYCDSTIPSITGFPSPGSLAYDSTVFATSTRTLEFSGGDFLKSSSSHFVISDRGRLNEYTIENGEISEELASYRIQGFSGDYEGICLYGDQNDETATVQLAILDERNRTAALCTFPPSDGDRIDLEGDECISYSLSNADKADPSITSPEPNRGFEGVACDAAAQKLYIAQEKSPMTIWQLDLVTGVFDVLIPASTLDAWTDLVDDIAGVRFSCVG
jgi:hypothetical protein